MRSSSATAEAPLRPLAEAVLLAVVLAGGVVLLSAALGTSGQRIATIFGVNVCAVLAFQVFSGTSGIVSFGHTAFMGVGAYLSAWLTMPATLQRTAVPNLPQFLAGHELPLLASIGLVALAGALLALLSGLPIARLNGASASIATLGFLIIVYSVLAAAIDFTRGNQAFYGVPRVTNVYVATGMAALFVVLARLYRESRPGLMLRAVRDNETAAIASGVNPAHVRLTAWLLSGAMAAVAGALYGHMLGAFSPRDFYFTLTFAYIAMMIVGGIGTVTGAVGGVALIMALQAGLQKLEGGFVLGPVTVPEVFGLPIVGVSIAILAVLMFRPAGLFGAAELSLPASWLPRPQAARVQPAARPPSTQLRIDGVHKSFVGLAALTDVSASIETGRITGLIGPNGAGKSTLVNTVTGLSPLTKGRIFIGDRRINEVPAHAMAGLGIARSFQNIRLFEGLSAEENVMIGAIASGAGRTGARAVAAQELGHVGLSDVAATPAGSLAYGARRRLEIARAMAGNPTFLLLDEPAAGMNPEETADLAARLRELPALRGLGILLIDHDLKFIMSLCDRVIVLDRGRVIADAAPSVVQRDPAVIEAYLGTRASRVPVQSSAEAATTEPTGEMKNAAI